MNTLKTFFLSLLLIFGIIFNTYASEINSNNLIKIDITKNINKNIKIGEELTIDLTESKKNLEKFYNKKIIFEWNIPGETTINGAIFSKTFETFGNKTINLNIYKLQNRNKELIKSSTLEFFVYKNKINAVFDKQLEKENLEFTKKAKELGILIDKIELYDYEIEKYDFKENILDKLNEKNYLLISGEKDFIFDLLSKFNQEKIQKKINIVGISPFNINILQKKLEIFLSNKNWLNKAILLDEASKFEVLKESGDINKLIENLKKNKYNFIILNTKGKINNMLFISKFINNLSNLGFSINNIYLILTIPFILIGIIVFKHLIGLTPAGILIPTVLTLLFLKFGLVLTTIFFLIFILVNVGLSKLFYKYSLHYTPKIVLLIMINILIFIILINILIGNNIVNININDVMFLILFVLISERLINIIISKEFGEYKNTLINTLLFAIIIYLILSINFIKTIILTYSEIILILLPIAFLIGRFTGLRITEYFRFKEIIKSIEE